jgi:hypothetical protein
LSSVIGGGCYFVIHEWYRAGLGFCIVSLSQKLDLGVGVVNKLGDGRRLLRIFDRGE